MSAGSLRFLPVAVAGFAVYGLQDLFVEVLDADAKPVESRGCQFLPILSCHPARMTFDCFFRVFNQFERI